jgi:hypothetical protein
MMLRKIIATTFIAFGLSAGAASAGTVWAQAVTGFNMDGSTGSCSLAAGELTSASANSSRSNLCNSLGQPDHPGNQSEFGFFSAGNYDALKFTFGGPVTGPIQFFEITFNQNRSWTESLNLAFLLVGQNGAAFGTGGVFPAPTGSVTNSNGSEVGDDTFVVSFGDASIGRIMELWVFDTSAANRGTGFDIDAIGAVAAPAVIPLPAAGFLLLAGLGGLAVMRRRRG